MPKQQANSQSNRQHPKNILSFPQINLDVSTNNGSPRLQDGCYIVRRYPLKSSVRYRPPEHNLPPCSLRHYPTLPSQVTNAIHESLIDHHGFLRSSRWTVKLRLYTPVSEPDSPPPPPTQAKSLYFLDFGDADVRVWSFTAHGDEATSAEAAIGGKEVKGVMIEGEKDLEVIVVKIQNMWNKRQEALIEVGVLAL